MWCWEEKGNREEKKRNRGKDEGHVGGTNREVAEREVEPVEPKGCAVSVENADDPRSLELAKRWCLE